MNVFNKLKSAVTSAFQAILNVSKKIPGIGPKIIIAEEKSIQKSMEVAFKAKVKDFYARGKDVSVFADEEGRYHNKDYYRAINMDKEGN